MSKAVILEATESDVFMLDSLKPNHASARRRPIHPPLVRLYCLLLAWGFLLSPSLAYANEIKADKRVLILFPNQSDLPAYPLVEKGIKSRLATGTEFHIEYYIEYMDWYRNADPSYRQLLLDTYLDKFSRHRLDLVITCFVPALDFVDEYRDTLFPHDPIIFSGIPWAQIEGLTLGPMTTGVLADIDYAGLLETALKIHSETQHLSVVNGASQNDPYFAKF